MHDAHDHEHGHEPGCDTCPDRDARVARNAEAAALPEEAPLKIHRRFDRMARLVGDGGLERLARAHVVIVGCGGVGSFAAEALARSGVGAITLVDFDLVCITNTNRQLHAMKGTIGKSKVEVMAERLRLIHPTARIVALSAFYTATTRDQILGPVDAAGEAPTYVIDAIDNVTAKLDLLATCVKRGIPIVTAMGAAGRMDPTAVKIRDLALTERDALAKDVRKWLQRKHDVAPGDDGLFGIPAVYSDEPIALPADVRADAADGFACVCPHGSNDVHSCENRARIDGTASFVTGVFGLVAAGHVVREIAQPSEATRVKRTPRPQSARPPRRVRHVET